MADRAPSATPRTLWLDPGFGASGDMMLGVLLGLGAPIEAVRYQLEELDVSGWSLTAETTMRCSLASNRALVATEEQHHHRTWSTIDTMLADSNLADQVKAGARATFRRLGEAEAGIHNVDIDQVHFHEVGAIDAIVDIVGSWAALHLLGITEVVSGPVGMGHGTVGAAHGTLPVPAPATAALLIGAKVKPVDVAAETVTPTGAALLATMTGRWGPLPAGTMTGLARGAGGRDPDHYPNVLTGIVIEPAERPLTVAPDPTAEGKLGAIEVTTTAVLTTNIDDLTPELVAHTISRCVEMGAADAWATPIVMKKGRPAVELNVMCSPDQTDMFLRLLQTETGTLGVRVTTTAKHVLGRHITEVTVRGRKIRVKVGPFGVKPEYEDLAAAGRALDVPVRQLSLEALAAYEAAESSGNSASELANGEIAGQTRTP